MLFIAIVVVWCAGRAVAADRGHVVFVRDNQIYTANEDGSGVVQATSTETKFKQYPKWSPDGTRIAFLTDGDMIKDPKSRAKIEIITHDGKRVATAPVLVTLPDGTEVGGMRWVDSIGWFDVHRVFAEGSVNPYAGEFRTIELQTGKMGGYSGFEFSTCPSKGLVAYWAPVFPPSKTMRLEINERAVGFEFPDYNVLPTLSVPLLWTPDCQYLAFVDLRQPATLVLVQAGKVGRKVILPSDDFKIDGLTPDNRGLLLTGSIKTLLYDFEKNTLSDAPPPLLKQMKFQREARERVVRELGGESPDWWTDPRPSQSKDK
jgi:hypothetical protein